MATRPDPVARGLGALVLGALTMLLMLAVVARVRTGAADAFDPALLRGVRALTGERGIAVELARGVTVFGNNLTLWLVALFAGALLAVRRQRAACLHLFGACAGGAVLVTAIKLAVHRVRPEVVPHLVQVTSLSFPSGHAADSSYVYGTLAMLAARASPRAGERRLLAGACTALIVGIGVSRVALGVHWPSDVLSGWAIGAGWALACAHLAGRGVSRR
jgi:undecaprenyl-diphosphatase